MPKGQGSSSSANGGGDKAHDGSEVTMRDVMASLGASVGAPATLKYGSKDAKSTCPLYVGLGENGMSFKKWHDTKFMPRVWLPKEAEGRKARDKKLLQLRISAHTSMLRHRPSRPPPSPTNIPLRRWRMDGEDPPDDEAEDVLAAEYGAGGGEHEGAEDVSSINGEDAGRMGPMEVDGTTLSLMHELADTELKTKDEHFECLVEYVSEDSQMKSAILEDIIDKGLHGQPRLVYFIEQMEASTSTVVLQKAIWLGIAREGIIEQPKAYAVRFSKAALDCGRTKADINQRFMETLLEPWDREPDLKPLIPTFKAKHCLEVQDDKVLHVHAMAETAFMYETMIAQVTVSKMERAGSLAGKASTKKGASHKQDDNEEPQDAEEASTKLGLPSKTFASGKTYRACAACHVVRLPFSDQLPPQEG